jgi:hypothetical protein
MTINFDELKKQQLNSTMLLNIIEVIYNNVKTETFQNIVLNEYVDDLVQESSEYDVYSFELANTPISTLDILIVSEDGSIVITPSSITQLDGKRVYVKSLQLTTGHSLYVTYKY